MLPHVSYSALPHPSHAALASQRRTFRLLLVAVLLVPLLLYSFHLVFASYGGLARAQCVTELDAVHLHYKERMARLMADLHKQVSKETELLQNSARQERELLNTQLAAHAAQQQMRELQAQLADVQQQQQENAATQLHQQAMQSTGIAANVSPFSPVAAADGEVVTRSGSVEVRRVETLLQQKQAESSATAATVNGDGGAGANATVDGSPLSSDPAAPPSAAPDVQQEDENDPVILSAEAIIQRLDAEQQQPEDEEMMAHGPASVDGPTMLDAGTTTGAAGSADSSRVVHPTSSSSSPHSHSASHQILKESAPIGTPVVVLTRSTAAGGNVAALRATIDTLLANQPPTGFPIFVSVEARAGGRGGANELGGSAVAPDAATDAATTTIAQLLAEHKGKIHVLYFNPARPVMPVASASSSVGIEDPTGSASGALPAAPIVYPASNAAHLRFVLSELFDYLGYSALVLLSAGQRASPDFFAYFGAMERVLEADPATLMCASGWNERGTRKMLGGSDAALVEAQSIAGTADSGAGPGANAELLHSVVGQVYRTSVWPASEGPDAAFGDDELAHARRLVLGFMLRRELWTDELRAQWPMPMPSPLPTGASNSAAPSPSPALATSNWADWLRSTSVSKGRDCLYPETSRVSPGLWDRDDDALDVVFMLAQERLPWSEWAVSPAAAAANGGVGGGISALPSSTAVANNPAGPGSTGALDFLLDSLYPAYVAAIFDAPSTVHLSATSEAESDSQKTTELPVAELPTDEWLTALRANRTALLREAEAQALALSSFNSSSSSSVAVAAGGAPVTGGESAGVVPSLSESAQAQLDLSRQRLSLLRRDGEVVVRYNSLAELKSLMTALGARASYRQGGATPRASWRGILSYRRLGHRIWIVPTQAAMEQLEQEQLKADTQTQQQQQQQRPQNNLRA
jgi:hypothetical protein